MNSIYKELIAAKTIRGHTYNDIAKIYCRQNNKTSISHTAIINTAKGLTTSKQLFGFLQHYIDTARSDYTALFNHHVKHS